MADNVAQAYSRGTLKSIGDYATLSAQGTHFTSHDPIKALRNIMETCRQALENAEKLERSASDPLPGEQRT
jgi:hypothetical protein